MRDLRPRDRADRLPREPRDREVRLPRLAPEPRRPRPLRRALDRLLDRRAVLEPRRARDPLLALRRTPLLPFFLPPPRNPLNARPMLRPRDSERARRRMDADRDDREVMLPLLRRLLDPTATLRLRARRAVWLPLPRRAERLPLRLRLRTRFLLPARFLTTRFLLPDRFLLLREPPLPAFFFDFFFLIPLALPVAGSLSDPVSLPVSVKSLLSV